MSKHHMICKSKTLDVPIIITSQIVESSDNNQNDSNNNNLPSHMKSNSHEPFGQLMSQNTNKFKLDKGFSLDSHYLKSQNSLSSSTSNDFTSSSNSISSSNNSIQQFQYTNQNFLVPPSTINQSLSQSYNINADFETEIFPKNFHEIRNSSFELGNSNHDLKSKFQNKEAKDYLTKQNI